MNRRPRIALQGILTLAAVVVATAVIRAEVVDQTSSLARPVDVAADAEVDIEISTDSAPEPLVGSFRIEEVTDHAELTPTTEYDDPVRRDGGRVVVVGIRCECPISEDVLAPNTSVMDGRGRVWESDGLSQPRPDDYAELDGYSPGYRVGDEDPYRYAVAIIVPTDVAGEVRPVLQREPGPAYRFAR